MINIDKETFHKKWYYRLLQIIFWGTLIPLVVGMILLGLTEDDLPAAGFFWAAVTVLVYWLAKRMLYYVLFREYILPVRNK